MQTRADQRVLVPCSEHEDTSQLGLPDKTPIDLNNS